MQVAVIVPLAASVAGKTFDRAATINPSGMMSLAGLISGLWLIRADEKLGRVKTLVIWEGLRIAGIVLSATCRHDAQYVAAQALYSCGSQGISLMLSFIAVDISVSNSLWRPFITSFITVPTGIVPLFASSLTQAILQVEHGDKIFLGLFGGLIPILQDLILWLIHSDIIAKKPDKHANNSDEDNNENNVDSNHSFSPLGIIRASFGTGLALAGFGSLWASVTYFQDTDLFWILTGVGWGVLVAFGLWEKFVADPTIIPWEVLYDRTMLGCCIITLVIEVSRVIFTDRIAGFMMVVLGADGETAGKVSTIQSILVTVAMAIISLALTKLHLRVFRLLSLVGTCVCLVANVFDVNFRDKKGVWSICGFSALSALGTSLVITSADTVSQEIVVSSDAVIMGVRKLCGNTGSFLAWTIITWGWQAKFDTKLGLYLPDEHKKDLSRISGSQEVQLSFKMGSDVRNAINAAWVDTTRSMLLGALTVYFVIPMGMVIWNQSFLDASELVMKERKKQRREQAIQRGEPVEPEEARPPSRAVDFCKKKRDSLVRQCRGRR
ncbi:siderophore iron transporter [Colletotrichum musicola]|uniref:Siderophore iron transporter n=1 Tax=Colletotrichum musicola TaxID=2175873 RepID=A0A8H6KYA9_9PEZI|nr:siderophore iron transporter [Colletotrichum musicola]